MNALFLKTTIDFDSLWYGRRMTMAHLIMLVTSAFLFFSQALVVLLLHCTTLLHCGLLISIREPVIRKIRDYLGVFPNCRTPPIWEASVQKKNLRVYFAF